MPLQNMFHPEFRITSYNVCYTKLLRIVINNPVIMLSKIISFLITVSFNEITMSLNDSSMVSGKEMV